MVCKATMDYVRTIVILVELNGRYFTRPDVYMYVCSLCTVTDDPMGNCLWWWDSPTWVSDSLLIPAYLPAFPLLILTSKVWISKNNNSSSTKDIESVVLTNWLGRGVDLQPLTKEIWKAGMEAGLEKRPIRYLKSPCDSHFHLKTLFIWLCWVLVAVCRIPSCGIQTLSWGMWDLFPDQGWNQALCIGSTES